MEHKLTQYFNSSIPSAFLTSKNRIFSLILSAIAITILVLFFNKEAPEDYAIELKNHIELLKKASPKDERIRLQNQILFYQIKLRKFEDAAYTLDFLSQSFPFSAEEEIAKFYHYKGLYYYYNSENKSALANLAISDSLYSTIYPKGHPNQLEVVCLSSILLGENRELDTMNERINKVKILSIIFPNAHNALVNMTMAVQQSIGREQENVLNKVNLVLADTYQGSYIDSFLLIKAHITKAHIIKKLSNSTLTNEEINAIQSELETALKLATSIPHNEQLLKEVYEQKFLTNIKTKVDSSTFSDLMIAYESQFDSFPYPLQHPKDIYAFYHYRVSKKYDQTIQLYTDLFEIYDSTSTNGRLLRDEGYYIVSQCYSKLNQIDSALHYNQLWANLFFKEHDLPLSGLELEKLNQYESQDIKSRTIFHSKKANILVRSYELDNSNTSNLFKAIRTYEQLDTLFFKYNNINRDADKAFKKELLSETYSLAIDACYRAYKINNNPMFISKALRFIERLKYASFFSALIEENQEQPKEDTKEDMLRTLIQEKNQNINEIIKTIAETKEHKKADYQLLKEQYYSRIYFDIPSLDSIQAKIETPILNYKLANDETVHTILITPDTTLFHEQKSTESITALHNKLLNSVQDDKSTPRDFIIPSNKLHKLYIQPFEDILKDYDQIVVCQDASLPLLPFELLSTTPTARHFSDIDYLLNEYNAISYSFSLNTYYNNLVSQKQYDNNSKVLGFAYSQLNHKKYKPLRKDLEDYNSYKQSRKIVSRNTALEELEGSAMELQLIEELFQDGTSPSLYYADEASKRQYLSSCDKDFDIIHLAVHASASEEKKFNQNIYFKDDSLAYNEVISNPVQASLIILSACQTASGKQEREEGTYSLSRAFFLAGAEEVVSSLWNLNDRSAPMINYFFYQAMLEGIPLNVALHNAKKQYLEVADKSAKAHPHFWGGLVLLE